MNVKREAVNDVPRKLHGRHSLPSCDSWVVAMTVTLGVLSESFKWRFVYSQGCSKVFPRLADICAYPLRLFETLHHSLYGSVAEEWRVSGSQYGLPHIC